MFGFDKSRELRDTIFDQDGKPINNEAELSHEAIGGAAAFYAMHEYEKKQREEGKEVDHGFAKEVLAGMAGAAIDRLVETKGADFYDKEKAKYEINKSAGEHLNEYIGQGRRVYE